MPPARRSRRSTPSYKIVGQPIKREDVAPKVFAQEDFVTDIKVPGMVHGRMIRPPVAGAVPVKVDESSIKDIPGAQVVCEKGFLGVVARQGVGRDQGRRRSSRSSGRRSSRRSRTRTRSTTTSARRRCARRQVEKQNGNVDEAFKTAARVIEAEYEWPFQSHACMGPACAVVEIKDGKVNCWTGSQKSHFVQIGLAGTARRAARQRPRASG